VDLRYDRGMASTGRAPSHRRGAAVHRAVLQATTELLTEHGLAGARIADIAARAGVHETSIYRRWSTRAHLIAEAVSTHLDTELPLPDTGSTREDLTTFFTALATVLSTPTGPWATLLGFAPPDEQAQFDQLREQFWTARLHRAGILVQRGVDRGELRPDTEPELLLEALAGPLHLRILQRHRPSGRPYVSALVDLVVDGARSPARLR
jgi:AcrR family transcriptional regulator